MILIYGVGRYESIGYQTPVSIYAVKNEQQAKDTGLSNGEINGLKKTGQIALGENS